VVSNAQVAVLAAAASMSRADDSAAMTTQILVRATRFNTWLDEQDRKATNG